MSFRSLRLSLFAALTTLTLLGSAGVARAQEGPIDHLRHRTHQIIRATDRAFHGRPPAAVRVRVYVPAHRRYEYRYRYRVYDRRCQCHYYRTYR
jgi:hypothetical protein